MNENAVTRRTAPVSLVAVAGIALLVGGLLAALFSWAQLGLIGSTGRMNSLPVFMYSQHAASANYPAAPNYVPVLVSLAIAAIGLAVVAVVLGWASRRAHK